MMYCMDHAGYLQINNRGGPHKPIFKKQSPVSE
jgi:hypothetical protein